MNATEPDWLLEVLSPDGRVGRAIELREPEVYLGRTGRGPTFPDDSEMADRHAYLRVLSEGVEISGNEEGSGVWVRVQGGEGRRLAANDQIWVGAQFLVVVKDNDRWHLRHHSADGSPVELHEIQPPGLFIGRGSDLMLDLADRALSRRHAQISVEGDGLVLYDRGAHNGTYLKLNAPEILGRGDEFRMATQHLRLIEWGTEASVPKRGVEPESSDGSGDRPSGEGLAARLRALAASRTQAVVAQPLAPSGRAEDGAGREPSGAPVAHKDSGDEIALVVIDSDEGSVSLELEHGKTVLEAVQEAGLERGAPIDWECLDGRCGVCVVGVVEGADRLEPPDSQSGEMRTIQITEQVVPDPTQYRLACLARVRGTVRLRRLT